jgi:hypothetical protein
MTHWASSKAVRRKCKDVWIGEGRAINIAASIRLTDVLEALLVVPRQESGGYPPQHQERRECHRRDHPRVSPVGVLSGDLCSVVTFVDLEASNILIRAPCMYAVLTCYIGPAP